MHSTEDAFSPLHKIDTDLNVSVLIHQMIVADSTISVWSFLHFVSVLNQLSIGHGFVFLRVVFDLLTADTPKHWAKRTVSMNFAANGWISVEWVCMCCMYDAQQTRSHQSQISSMRNFLSVRVIVTLPRIPWVPAEFLSVKLMGSICCENWSSHAKVVS